MGWCLIFSIVFLSFNYGFVDCKIVKYDIQMDGFTPTMNDQYVSLTVKAPKGFIVAYHPFASADRLHHLMIAGCKNPYHDKLGLNEGPYTCENMARENYIYSWAKNAGDFVLPKNVSVRIGHEDDDAQYLVVIFHYANIFVGDVKDYSGVTLFISDQPTEYTAIEYLFAAAGSIPPQQQETFVNLSCTYTGDVELTPFAYRVHAHDRGLVVTGMYHNQDSGWNLIGKRHPLWPQEFTKIPANQRVVNGDILTTICSYNTSNDFSSVHMGMTNGDEMCNFQIMFYYKSYEKNPFKEGATCFYNQHQNLFNKNLPSFAHTVTPWNQTIFDMGKGKIGFGLGKLKVIKDTNKNDLDNDDDKDSRFTLKNGILKMKRNKGHKPKQFRFKIKDEEMLFDALAYSEDIGLILHPTNELFRNRLFILNKQEIYSSVPHLQYSIPIKAPKKGINGLKIKAEGAFITYFNGKKVYRQELLVGNDKADKMIMHHGHDHEHGDEHEHDHQF